MRPITELFADIVGSTGVGERLGPDEVRRSSESAWGTPGLGKTRILAELLSLAGEDVRPDSMARQ
jgi:hypothetical protein